MFSLVGAMAMTFTSCEEDDACNPTFVPKGDDYKFELYTPAIAGNNTYDLASSEGLALSCSQPDYDGVPYVVRYHVQVALEDNFTEDNFRELESNFTTASFLANATEINNAMLDIFAAKNVDTAYPDEARAIYIRLRACVENKANVAMDEVYSNTIKLPNVLAQYIPPTLEVPSKLFLVGSSIGDGADKGYWSYWKEMAPVYGNAGEFYSLCYFPDGAAFKWGEYEGDWRGYDAVTEFDDAVNAGLEKDGDGNIKIGTGGWYTIYVESKVGSTQVNYTFHILKGEAYTIGNATGAWDGVAMTMPADGGVWESEAFTAAGELRAYIKVGTIDWWRTEYTLHNGELYWRTVDIPENWAANVGNDYSVACSEGQKLYVDFNVNTGVVK